MEAARALMDEHEELLCDHLSLDRAGAVKGDKP